MRLYKYTEKQYLNNLLKDGEILVGTLYDYRKDKHKQGIRDAVEGKKIFSLPDKPYAFTNRNDPDAKLLEQFGTIKFEDDVSDEDQFNVFIGNVKFEHVQDSPDCFVFCLSTDFSYDTQSKFEGYDACYSIDTKDLTSFTSAITESLNKITPVTFAGIFPVHYTSRKVQWTGSFTDGTHGALIKEPNDYEDQFERRAIWCPNDSNVLIEPAKFQQEKLRSLIKKHNVPFEYWFK